MSCKTPSHSFIFTGPDYTLACQGVAREFASVEQAVGDHGSQFVVGALAFHVDEAPRLFAPQHAQFHDQMIPLAHPVIPAVMGLDYAPPRKQHERNIADVIEEIHRTELEKIVLSRAEHYRLQYPVDPEAVLAGFLTTAGSAGYGYLVQLADDGHCRPSYFVGPSPEVLIAKKGRRIYSFPLAGTARRSPDLDRDRAIAEELRNSTKDLHEHAFVTGGIREVLSPLCETLSVPEAPELMNTSHTWHLGTRIEGVLRDNCRLSVLELAALLHPTAAVSGYPAGLAARLLRQREPERGFYSGAVGFMDAHGDGEWRVAIRSATVSGDRVTAFAGGGIVAGSDPQAELAETDIKLGPIRSVLGV